MHRKHKSLFTKYSTLFKSLKITCLFLLPIACIGCMIAFFPEKYKGIPVLIMIFLTILFMVYYSIKEDTDDN